MKKARIYFTLSLDVAVIDKLDLDWVADRFLSSHRFGTDRVAADPSGVTILCASSSIDRVVVCPNG